MAYNQSNGYQNRSNNSASTRAPAPSGEVRKFEPDPNDAGIGYEKDMKAGGKYIQVTVTKDIKAGTKLSIFTNDKVKNRTEKTPTHKVKLSVSKQTA